MQGSFTVHFQVDNVDLYVTRNLNAESDTNMCDVIRQAVCSDFQFLQQDCYVYLTSFLCSFLRKDSEGKCQIYWSA